MKKILALFLAFVILSQVFVNVGIGVYYHVNKTYIIQKLCENKTNPQLHCNGHCYLSKQLKKAEDRENKSLQLIKEKEEIIPNRIKNLLANYFPNFVVVEYPLSSTFLCYSDSQQSLLKPPAV